MPDPEEERIGFEDAPGDFEENLAALLGVDPETVEDGEEEPPQE
jgi:hypothetical protein